MKLLTFYEDESILAACVLRDPALPCGGSLALHTNDDPTQIMSNRQMLSDQIRIPLSEWCCAKQTHSADYRCVQKEDRGNGSRSMTDVIAQCDALYTKEKGILIGVFTADCIPLLLYDPASRVSAAIHSGWPGTVRQITTHTVKHLMETQGLDPATTKVWIGPCIHQPSFQIREDVITQIQQLPFDTSPYLQFQPDGSALADNVGLNVHMLGALGIPKANITVSPYDTFADGDAFFSYRKNHTTGRHYSFIYQKPQATK